MKKSLIRVFTVLFMLVLILCGCGKKDKDVDKETNAFKAPKNYVSVVQVKINPTVNLYLDADEVILAVEYVNFDAKESYSKVEKKIVGSKLSDAMTVVIETAEEDGYLEKNKKVTIDVIETKQEEKKLDILTVATQSAQTVISEKKIEAEVVLTKTAQKEMDDKVAADKAAADKAAADKAAADKAAADKAAAEKDKKNPTKNLKKNTEYRFLKPGEDGMTLTYFMIKFYDGGEYSIGEAPYTLDQYGEGPSVVYNGKTYHMAGGGNGSGGNYTVTDERVILSGGDDIVFTMNTDGNLVIEKPNTGSGFFKVGDVLTAN